MCFVNESDWTADVTEESTHVAEKPWKCDECLRTMAAGTTMHHVYMQEHKECHACEEGECECNHTEEELNDITVTCRCAKPAYGETFDYDRCDDCDKFLEAVMAAELEAGCAAHESLPPYCEMIECIQNGGADEAKKYFKKALVLHRELQASGYLGWLWNRMFVR